MKCPSDFTSWQFSTVLGSDPAIGEALVALKSSKYPIFTSNSQALPALRVSKRARYI
jgi:hypothetical protein